MKLEDIKTITMVGSGDMGHGIAELSIMAGLKVNLYDIKQEFVDSAIVKMKDSLDKQVAKGKLAADDVTKMMSGVKTFTVLKDAVKDADYVIEAAPEILELKEKIFRELDEFAPKHAILASNTSNMSITQIAAATKRPEKVVGLHFFNPVVLMLLVEVIRGAKTTDETMNISYDLVKKMKNFKATMVPVRVEKDTPGFIYNRMQSPLQIYLMESLERKLVDPEGVDAKLRSLGNPMGPYEIMDFTGLDINFHGVEYFAEKLSPDYAPRPWLKKAVESGNLGKKTGKGIFTWPNGARPTIDMAKADPNFDPVDFFCIQVNEGTKLIEDGIANNATDIDVACMNGGGIPMGPFARVKDMGWDKVAARCEEISKKLGVKWFMPTEMLKKGNIKL